ncbi:sulfite exporter TauE/SafE family protein [Pseudaestuariivita atlantica]|uniref:Probable membrane transporter protein n=1 Tax=Pseudaestuariivita atlantica TaxID=1317121 RepID=A0A0L1JNA9_9RHOB|nr:sulfite exporter TauE/SafE family protein [Pseudaestuariivita atlantica]KNG93197.1 membrane protein [Pseudaestuariivita atlantica]
MDLVFGAISPGILALAAAVAVLAGLVKGLVGFAMPMIIVAGLGSFVAPDLALAALILPTLVTNVMQALAQGPRAAWRDARRFMIFMVVGAAFLVAVAQFVPLLDPATFFVALGVPVVLFTLSQLGGWQPPLHRLPRAWAQAGTGMVAGTLGGLSGVWGPPTVMMLTAFGTEKAVQMRVQGVVYGLGAVLLVVSHLHSGILDEVGTRLSLLLILPAVVGMALGTAMQPRIDQAMFRRLTLGVLLIAGLNLIRRGFLG